MAEAEASSALVPARSRSAPVGTPSALGKRPASVLSLMQPPSKAAAVVFPSSAPARQLDDEIAKFKALRAGVEAEGQNNRFYEKGIFNQRRFWHEHRTELPLHYQTYVPEVGSQKAASSNVETVFSGVGGMVQKATTLGSELTESYTICHHNWLYEFLEPSEDEAMVAYLSLNGPEPHDSDACGSSSEEDNEEVGDDGGEGEEMQTPDHTG